MEIEEYLRRIELGEHFLRIGHRLENVIVDDNPGELLREFVDIIRKRNDIDKKWVELLREEKRINEEYRKEFDSSACYLGMSADDFKKEIGNYKNHSKIVKFAHIIKIFENTLMFMLNALLFRESASRVHADNARYYLSRLDILKRHAAIEEEDEIDRGMMLKEKHRKERAELELYSGLRSRGSDEITAREISLNPYKAICDTLEKLAEDYGLE